MQKLTSVILLVLFSLSITQSAVPSDPNEVKLSYCGAKPRPPHKDLLCQEICDDGVCRDFYCECPRRPASETNCVAAVQNSRKCEEFCAKKANLANASICPVQSEGNKNYCVCF